MNPINKRGLILLLLGAALISTGLLSFTIFSLSNFSGGIIAGVGIILFIYGISAIMDDAKKK